jgi:hypothetical protein
VQTPSMTTRTSPVAAGKSGRLLWCCALIALCCSSSSRAAENRAWENSPYRVLATVAVDDGARPQPGLEAALARSIADRVEGALRPLWAFELSVPNGGIERRQCFDLREIPWEELSADQTANDKLLWLGVRVTPNGYELACREFDVYVRRWGPVRRSFVQQASFLPEASFALLKDAFSPLALITPIEGNDEQVQLSFKGSSLPRPAGEEAFVKVGAAYLPVLRRTDRSGKLVPGGIMPVPWTYLTVAEPGSKAQDADWAAAIHSGVRRPFGGVKRGTVEQLAIGIGNSPGATQVRFHTRTDKTQGLAGYEVFRAGPKGEPQRIGVTDRDGMITIPPTDEKISMLMLRSDGQVLAKVPVVIGGSEEQQTPIADNVTRLQAQAEAQVIREDLIDLVARRAIMMGRVKSMLKNDRVKEAKELMGELDALPSPSVFGRTIENAARKIPRSDDPSVQKRIDALFSSTREILSKYLSTRPITDLQAEVDAAANAPPPSAGETSEAPSADVAPTS